MKKKIKRLLAAVGLLLCTLQGNSAWAGGGAEPFLGEMIWVPYNFAPRGWAFCDGQLLPISQNSALFSLLGTNYGGNGTSDFALPDMRGRLMISAGQGPGLSDYAQGQTGGEATHTLIQSELPPHNHALQASTAVATATAPTNSVYGQAASGNLYGDNGTATMAANAIGAAGGGQAHNNMMPVTTLNCIIALQGIFPSRP